MNSSVSSSRSVALRRRWFIALTAAAWLALLAGYLGAWWWPLDLLSHFRPQYAVLFAVLAVAALVARMRALAVLAGLGALTSGAPVVAYAGLTPAVASTAQFRLISFNTWYRYRDHTRLAEYLRNTDADVVVLQEITPQQLQKLKSELPGYEHSYAGAAKPHGAAILSRWPIASATPWELTPDGARAADVRILWRDTTLAIIGVHLHWPLSPAGSRMRGLELAAIAERAVQMREPALVSGDFNITPWSQRFRQFLSASGLTDCARGHRLAPTWPAQLPAVAQIRIDHCFASPHWRVVDVSSGPYLGSDHRPMVAELELKTAKWPLDDGKLAR